MDPFSVVETVEFFNQATHLPNPTRFGVPFFDHNDLDFLVMGGDGAILTDSGEPVSPDLASFLSSLMQNPSFWIDFQDD